MKRFLLSLLLIIPFLTGCTNIDANLSINNKSALLDLQMISQDNAAPQELFTMKSNISKFLDKSEYKIEDKSTAGNVRVFAHKKVDNLLNKDLDLSSLGFSTKLPSGKFIEVKHNFFITLYNIDMVYNLPNQKNKIILASEADIPSVGGLKPEYLKIYSQNDDSVDTDITKSDFISNIDPNVFLNKSGMQNKQNDKTSKNASEDYKLFDINGLSPKFSISLNSPASLNNAPIVNGNVYTWSLSKTAPTEIHLVYVVYSGWAISFILLLGISLIVYLAYRIYRHESLKRIGNSN